MSEIIAAVYEKMEETGQRKESSFIDEINCVSETHGAHDAAVPAVRRAFGNQQVPEGWVIVAAGNPPEPNKSVREFDVVTLGPCEDDLRRGGRLSGVEGICL